MTLAEEVNPLALGLERQPVHPTTLVIFGATGDLARRKLLPALYNLAADGALPERFNLIGVSRSEKEHEDFAAEAREAIEQFSRRENSPIDSRARSRKPSSPMSERETPIRLKRSGSAPSCARL